MHSEVVFYDWHWDLSVESDKLLYYSIPLVSFSVNRRIPPLLFRKQDRNKSR